ncbi:MAG: exodeoxyribonuclease VII large subunit [Nitrospinae bacterium]|nr:exodeoxyribonuclease VII large subunit [Nitrospinota bacterium]
MEEREIGPKRHGQAESAAPWNENGPPKDPDIPALTTPWGDFLPWARQTVYTVSELTQQIKLILEGELPEVWVEGEISSLRRPSSGHLYFTLKDRQSQIRSVLFKSQQRGLKFELEDGLEVILRGRLSVYEPRGEYQIIVEHLEPKGIGAMQLALEQLKVRLAAEGIFDSQRKRALPLLPQKIGIVTSPTGAAIRDILQVIHRRFANVSVLLYPVRVQGDGAAQEIAEGIRALNLFSDIDALIVGRGGGSTEDLWAFNEEVVARAIFASSIPVISAVGHEIDFTLADLVADLRAPTPSAAAELVVQNKEELFARLQSLQILLSQQIRSILGHIRHQLQQLVQRRGLSLPQEAVRSYQQRLDELISRQERALRQDLIARRKELESLLARLNALSPLASLERGYSICRKLPSGAVVKDVDQVEVGEQVEVILHRGEIRCRVEEKGSKI